MRVMTRRVGLAVVCLRFSCKQRKAFIFAIHTFFIAFACVLFR